MKLVKFKDGTFGVRSGIGWLDGYVYLDFVNYIQWWSIKSPYMKNCKVDEATARTYFDRLHDTGTPVK